MIDHYDAIEAGGGFDTEEEAAAKKAARKAFQDAQAYPKTTCEGEAWSSTW